MARPDTTTAAITSVSCVTRPDVATIARPLTSSLREDVSNAGTSVVRSDAAAGLGTPVTAVTPMTGMSGVGRPCSGPQMMTMAAAGKPKGPLCKVCGDEASGFHYGVDSCEGCKVRCNSPDQPQVSRTFVIVVLFIPQKEKSR